MRNGRRDLDCGMRNADCGLRIVAEGTARQEPHRVWVFHPAGGSGAGLRFGARKAVASPRALQDAGATAGRNFRDCGLRIVDRRRPTGFGFSIGLVHSTPSNPCRKIILSDREEVFSGPMTLLGIRCAKRSHNIGLRRLGHGVNLTSVSQCQSSEVWCP
jgi:hypothetical protein